MKKLVLESLEKKVKVKDLTKAVYKVLGQVEPLKAELVFLGTEEMHNLNRETRGVDKTTDVLSYPSLEGIKGKILRKEDCPTELDGKYIFIGSIVLCLDKIKEQAKELGHTEEEERDYLIIHGLMHLFGYDHMNNADKAEMREKEKAVIAILDQKKKRK